MTQVLLAQLIWVAGSISVNAQNTSALRVPPSVQAELTLLEGQFREAVELECPNRECRAIGCKVSQFDVLDQQKTSSLPGLGEKTEDGGVRQYALRKVQCRLVVEESMDAEPLRILRRRIKGQVATLGVAFSLSVRKIPEKQAVSSSVDAAENIWILTFLPFLPWFLGLVLLAALIKWLLPRQPAAAEEEASPPSEVEDADSFFKLQKLSRQFSQCPGDTRLMLEGYLQEQNIERLLFFVDQFGADALTDLRSDWRYSGVLNKLSRSLRESRSAPPADAWETLERDFLAAQVQSHRLTLNERFEFLRALPASAFSILGEHLNQQEFSFILQMSTAEVQSAILRQMPLESQKQMSLQLVDFIELSPQQLTDLHERLRQLIREKGLDQDSSIRSYEIIENLSDQLEEGQRRNYLSDLLAEKGPSVLATSVLPETLGQLDETTLQEALLRVSTREAAAILSYFALKDQLDRMSPAFQKQIQKAWGQPKLGKQEILKAFSQVRGWLRQLDDSGQISLVKLNQQWAQV